MKEECAKREQECKTFSPAYGLGGSNYLRLRFGYESASSRRSTFLRLSIAVPGKKIHRNAIFQGREWGTSVFCTQVISRLALS